MGKEYWYHLGGGKSPSSTSSSTTCTSSSSYSSNYSKKSNTIRGRGGIDHKDASSSSSSSTATTGGGGGGCISAVFQLFDFHRQFHFPNLQHQSSFKFHSPSFPHHLPDIEPSTVLKGTEAPRNSLEVDHDIEPHPLTSSSTNFVRKDEHLLNMPSIKTSRDKRSANLASAAAETCSSPGTKTPTLVARLMGLDLIPDTTSSSPRPSSTLDITPLIRQSIHTPRTPHPNRSTAGGRKSCSDIVDSGRGARSLPETPRMSMGRRSDVDLQHGDRLSLHINNNKENINNNNHNNITSRSTVGEEFDFSRFRKDHLKCGAEEYGATRSPGHYARQIVKQVKESLSRRVGMSDITNTTRTRSDHGIINSSNDHISKPKKPPRNSRLVTEDSSPSCSPRPGRMSNLSGADEAIILMRPDNSVAKKSSGMKFGSGDERVGRPARLAATDQIKRPNKEEELFVRTGSRTRRSTNYHKNDSSVVVDKTCKTTACGIKKRVCAPAAHVAAAAAAVLPVKKDPSPPATKIPHKQAHDVQITSRHSSSQALSVSTSHRHCKEPPPPDLARDKDTDRRAELQYVHEILRSIGVEGDTQLSSFRGWFTPLHPLDPSIFSGLECRTSTHHSLDHRCERKLVFQLVDELLAYFLKPYLNKKPWIESINKFYGHSTVRTGSQLIDKLGSEIEGFPRANCQVLEDIDAIIDKDLPKSEARINQSEVEEEGEGLVSEIERDIWADLVREVVTD